MIATNTNSLKSKQVSYEIFQSYSTRILSIIGDVVKEANSKITSHKKGRESSTAFEKNIVLPSIKNNMEKIQNKVDAAFEGLNVKLIRINLPNENQTEAEARTAADFTFNLEIDGIEHNIPVNVKYTANKNADNVGGWAALWLCLYGSAVKPKNGMKALFQSDDFLAGKWKNDAPSDYFFLVFVHTPTEVISAVKVSSLLSLSTDEITYNGSQSFPVQSKISKNGKPVAGSMVAIRKNFLRWIIGSMITDLKTKIQILEVALLSLDKGDTTK